MDLPVQLVTEAPADPVIFVDGAAPPGSRVTLELSHWPGNATPPELRHDLSTGCALAFAKLPAERRRALAADARSIANNHYDTDGTLALFAVRHPDLALQHEETLLDAARAGDFFAWPTDEALCLDATIHRLSSHPASPLAHEHADWSALPSVERWNLCTARLLEELPALLAGDLAPWRALWEPVLERARSDRDRLQQGSRSEDAARSWTAWHLTGAGPLPGRHALFGGTHADRVSVLQTVEGGTECRLAISTRSWFDLVSTPRRPRPDLAALAERLNSLEGSSAEDTFAWRAQPSGSPSPELWFGESALELFAEHNEASRPSRLAPDVLAREIARTLDGTS